MPTFETNSEPQSTKILYLGHSGAGKTGSLLSLAAVGYNIRIMDLDKGVEILRDFLTNPKSPYLKAKPGHWSAEQCRDIIKRVSYVPVNETVKIVKGALFPAGDAWNKANDLLNNWVDGDTSYGHIESWSENDVLVIDGLSRLSQSAFNFQLKLNGRVGMRPEQGDFNLAQQMVLKLLELLYSSQVKCSIIMICHIKFGETEKGSSILRGFPQSVGKAIGPQVGQYFNHALLAKASGSGDNAKRVILTSTSGLIELKSAAPLRVKSEYPLETGLADYFRDIRGDTEQQSLITGTPKN